MKKYQKAVKEKFTEHDFTFSWFRGRKRCDNIFTFDVETTSFYVYPDESVHCFDKDKPVKFYDKCLKGGFVYIWMFGIDDTVYYGRTLEEYRTFINTLTTFLGAQILVFVHNLSFECQFLRNIFNEDVDIFARKKRKPLKIVDGDVEYRCSYMLTRLSLAKWAKSKKLPVQKMTGDLDYNVLRTPKTRLTKRELGYCENDCLVMYHGLKEYVEDFGSTWDIPLTQTGIVRKAYNDLLSDDDRLHRKMEKATPEFELYMLLLQAFWGGIAHASFKWVNELLHDLDSYDKKSSYPWELVSRKYPTSPFVKCKYNERYIGNENYSYLITAELVKFQSVMCHSYISASKCVNLQGEILDNGRIIYADYAVITCTNVDYEIILRSYEIEEKNVLDFRVSVNEYLPKKIRLFILEWFEKKTTLDGVEEMDVLYRKSKEFVNAIFGMMCTKEFTDEILYDGDWKNDKLTREKFDVKRAKKLRKKRKLNNCFQWGVWCTAYARASLWDSVEAEVDGKKINDETSVYLDTDSNKCFASETMRAWIANYNKKIYEKQDEIARDLGIPVSKLRPTRPDGKVCALGVYEYEGTYEEFKTLGAKKYAYKQDGEIRITVAGVRKKAREWLKNVDDLSEKLKFDYDAAKKNTIIYEDDQVWACINHGEYDEYITKYRYGICVQPTTYSFSMTEDFTRLIDQYTELHTELLEHNDVVKEIIRRELEKRETLQS